MKKPPEKLVSILKELASNLKGELHIDNTHLLAYSTDASAYQEKPIAVAFPENPDDIKTIVRFATQHKLPVIPRTAGTSLAGQVVGKGVVTDVSRTMTRILELNTEERWVKVEPGVIRDELNQYLQPHGFLFGPETSTSNRAMIGGMAGNNSCGANSLVYGSTRDKLIEVKVVLADGNETVFGPLTKDEFRRKCEGDSVSGKLEQAIYRQINDLLSDRQRIENIRSAFPKPSIKRRNTGYAIDLLADCEVFDPQSDKPFNFCKLIAGSEGTLCFITELKLAIDPLPPSIQGLLCVQFHSIEEALRANLIVLKHRPMAIELMDHYIFESTAKHRQFSQYRFFIKGNPAAVLAVQLHAETNDDLRKRAHAIENDLQQNGFGHHFYLATGTDVPKVWALRKAGLGLLSNIPGDAKPVPVVEDTAVDVNDLPAYIRDFNYLMEKRGLHCVHYAHAGSGELHLRPMINLKTKEGNSLFKAVAADISVLVKKYRGSLSGEHGDGRLRGEFIRYMVGAEVYRYFEEIKNAWDPNGIFNHGKITDTPPMNHSLRYAPGQRDPEIRTGFDFSEQGGILRAAEMCNGSADCRKTELTGGVMCPSYMATRDELHTTRSRANILRQMLTGKGPKGFTDPALKEVMELCLSCKGCKSECPSNVDMARLKSEFLFQNHLAGKTAFFAKTAAGFSKSMSMIRGVRPLYLAGSKLMGDFMKKKAGIDRRRSLPVPAKELLTDWYDKNYPRLLDEPHLPFRKKVYFFFDEFTNFLDVNAGKKAIELLVMLGYEVARIDHSESGRTQISKGFLNEAARAAVRNVKAFSQVASAKSPVIGIEPSTLLSFRDEYPDLVPSGMKETAQNLAKHALLIDEFLWNEYNEGAFNKEHFTSAHLDILFHGHCHQKSLADASLTAKILSIPEFYNAREIKSGCCGMAGSFGYEHYDLSMKIANLKLFPAIRSKDPKTVVSAYGTSCRQQIADGLRETSLHPVEILHAAINKEVLNKV